MKPLTTEFVQKYFDYMLGHFDAEIVPRDKVLQFVPGYDEFTTISDALALIGVSNPLSFIQRASFTVGRFICLNYEPGVSTYKGSLDYQCRNLGHELTHRLQYLEDPSFLVNYLTSRSKRAKYWVDASKPVLEIGFHRRGQVPSIALMVENLRKNYYVREADARVAKLHLEAYATPVKDGAVASEVGKEAIAFMRANGY